MAIKVKAKGQDAIDLLGMKNDFKGPHSATKDVAALNGDGSRGAVLMKENPASRQAEGKNSDETSDITKPVKETTKVPTPEAEPFEGYDIVRPVNRELPAGMPERARRASNQARDMRVALGRGKPATIVQE
jgi:hypothetical protein